MVLWQGITEGGTAVPVQVTEAGKVVAEGQQGQQGEEGPPGPPGEQGPQGEYGPGDDVDLGSITAGNITAAGATFSKNIPGGNNTLIVENTDNVYRGNAALQIKIPSNTFEIRSNDTANTFNSAAAYPFIWYSGDNEAMRLEPAGSITAAGDARFKGDVTVGDTANTIKLDSKNGSITAGSVNITNKAGFTVNGEVYFTSRGDRYKLFVSQGLVQAEPYTREMELRERAEALRKPRTTDSVPED